jgi:TRAP-type C4-dicarboxylate transport system permease small subunit
MKKVILVIMGILMVVLVAVAASKIATRYATAAPQQQQVFFELQVKSK